MTTTDQGQGRQAASKPWLSPFILPSGTTTRFVLLVAAVLNSSAIIYVYLYPASSASRFMWERDITHRCPRLPIDQQPACIAPLFREETKWVLLGLAVLFALAGLIYWLLPYWIIRRGRLVELTGSDSTKLVNYLDERVQEAELRRPPTFLVAPFNQRASAMAFGRFRREYVQLNIGLVAQFTTDRDRFGAVVRHELAHLRNRDVNKTYLTVAIWRAFLIAGVIPLALNTVHPALMFAPFEWHLSYLGPWQATAPTVVSILVLTLLVYLTRNAVLRARESYADVRAAGHGAAAATARAVVDELPRPRGGRWRALLRTHPHPDDRTSVLDDPDGLFGTGRWEMFGAGVTVALVSLNLRFVLDLAVTSLGVSILTARLVTGLAFTVIIVGFLTLTMGRASVRDVLRGLPLPGVVLPSLCLAAGFLLGEVVALIHGVTGSYRPFSEAGLVVNALSFGLLFVGVMLLSGWVVHTTAGWLPLLRGQSLGRACLIGVALTTVAFAPVFVPWFSFHGTSVISNLTLWTEQEATRQHFSYWSGPLASWTGLDYAPVTWVIQQGIGLACLTLLWLLPVISSYRRVPETSPRWMQHALPRAKSLPALYWQRPRPGLALGAGLAGAVGYGALLLVLQAGIRGYVAASTRANEGFLIVFDQWRIALAVLAQGVVAAFVAAGVRRHAIPLGLLAAFITGTLAAAAIVGVQVAASCAGLIRIYPGPAPCPSGTDTFSAAYTVQQVVIKGMVAAVAGGLLGLAFGKLLRRPKPVASAEASDATSQERPVAAGSTTVLTLTESPGSTDGDQAKAEAERGGFAQALLSISIVALVLISAAAAWYGRTP